MRQRDEKRKKKKCTKETCTHQSENKTSTSQDVGLAQGKNQHHKKGSRNGSRDTGSVDVGAGESSGHRCLTPRQKQTSLQPSASTSTDAPSMNAPSNNTPAAEDVFRFYYDSARKKYFRILPGQSNDITNAITVDTVRQKAAEEERLLRLTHLGTANGKRKPCVHGAIASSRRPWQNSHNITDTVFRSRSGQIQDPRKVQRKITEQVIRGLRPCGSRKILEHAEATDAYCRLQHMSYMEPSSDQSKLLCLWSLKDIIGQRIQLLNVKSFKRSHEDGSKKISIDVQPGDVVILQTRYNITGLKWAPQNDDDDRSDHILYTTTRSLRNNQSLAILRRLDSSALHNFRGNEYVLGKKATWSCAWNRHARQIGVGSEKMSVLVDAETRVTRKVHADKSDVLSLVFPRQNSGLLYSGTRQGHVCTHDLRESLRYCVSQLNHSTSVSHLHLMTDENYLLAADFSGKINLWDLRARAVVQSYEGNHNEYSSIPFHVDQQETVLYTAGQDCYSRLWNLKTSELLCTIPPPHPASRRRIPTLCYYNTMDSLTTDGCPGLLLGMLDELHFYSL